MGPNVVIFCRKFQSDQSPFNNDYYYHAYSDLLLTLKKKGANAFFATDNGNYLGNGLFKEAYTADSKIDIANYKKLSTITADIIYDKGGFNRIDSIKVLNPSFVHTITANKAETHRHFSQFQPLSITCSNQTELLAALSQLPGSMAVIKTPTGNGGSGVTISPKEQLLTYTIRDTSVVVQEFIDTSIGIPNFVEGMHDLRIKIGGGIIWGGTLRTPKQGEYRANVAQGGSERHLFPDEIPMEARKIAFQIDKYFSDYDRYYAIDLANTTKGWKLIELNSKPGLSPISMSAQAKHITKSLAEYLIALAEK